MARARPIHTLYGGAHLFSMASKLRLGGEAYLAAQRAYDGWNLFAIVIVGALAATLALTVALSAGIGTGERKAYTRS